MSVCSISLFLPPYLPGRWVRNYVAPSLALARRSLWSWEASLPLWCLTLLTWTALWREWWTPSSSTRARSDTHTSCSSPSVHCKALHSHLSFQTSAYRPYEKHVHHGFESHPRQIIFLRKSNCLGCAVLLCLVVCLTLLASLFLPSLPLIKHVYYARTENRHSAKLPKHQDLMLFLCSYSSSTLSSLHIFIGERHPQHLTLTPPTHTYYWMNVSELELQLQASLASTHNGCTHSPLAYS